MGCLRDVHIGGRAGGEGAPPGSYWRSMRRLPRSSVHGWATACRHGGRGCSAGEAAGAVGSWEVSMIGHPCRVVVEGWRSLPHSYSIVATYFYHHLGNPSLRLVQIFFLHECALQHRRLVCFLPQSRRVQYASLRSNECWAPHCRK